MIKRLLKDTVKKRLSLFPAVGLLGPRQAGKTTLAKSFAGIYFDLETESSRLKLDTQWNDLISANELIILDEAQAWPEIFPRIRSAIDLDRKRNARFLILGSVSPFLMTHVSEALTGRLSLVELTPLMLQELHKAHSRHHWFYGGYPDGGILGGSKFPQWQIDYLNLLAQRDLPNWGMHARPQLTSRLLKMLTICNGQLWNASQIGKSLGLSHNTVNTYVDFLEGAYIVRRLQSYHVNMRKRLTKSPKLYWRDSGLLHALAGITSEDDLLSQPWVGHSWEGYVIEQLITGLCLSGLNPDASFFRTSDGYELDLVVKVRKQIWAIEVKLSSSPSEDDMKNLARTATMISADKCILVSRTNDSFESGGLVSCSLPWFLENLVP
ncbi:MAG: hypothetical protein A2283_02000 [Lentisphaerae bacterium RIFOXYA12_FULL_48_11]|nr:MAG: hypothetical protein A2283_02000 [Lentisphaerae bacterium RIFOXYA12_FULL_48_11]